MISAFVEAGRVEWWLSQPRPVWRTVDSERLTILQTELSGLLEDVGERRESEDRGGQLVMYPDDPDREDEWGALAYRMGGFAGIEDRLLGVWNDLRLERQRRCSTPRRHVAATVARCRPPIVRARTAARPRERRERRSRSSSSSSSGDGSHSDSDSDSDPPLGGVLNAARPGAAA